MSVARTDGGSTTDAGSQSSDATDTSTTTASSESEELGSDWIREAFMGRVGLRTTPSEDRVNGGGAEPGQQTQNPKTEAETTTEPSQEYTQPFRTFRTQQEYDRALQSEVDRREARRRKEDKDRVEADLLENQPHEYARIKREELERTKQEQELLNSPTLNKRISDFASEQIATYDEQVLRPLQNLVVDSPEKAQLFSEGAEWRQLSDPIEGRGALGKALLALYDKQAKADARKTLLADPAFIKEILVKHGGQRAEPEQVSPAGAAPQREDASQDEIMNGVFRGRRTYAR